MEFLEKGGVMVEIIKAGTAPEDREHEAACLYCKTVIRFRQGEASIKPDRQGWYLSISCPVCGRAVAKEL